MQNARNYYLALPVYGIFIALINWVIKQMVRVFSKWLKFKDITSEAKFKMVVTFAVQFFNLTVPLLIINLNFSQIEWVLYIQQELFFDVAGPRRVGDLFFGGKYTDINREFLNSVN